ncbi:MAG TPA: hypothetical protein VK861_10860, partial [Bacteroidales bacterium]|nr:hypothetical protein [Bacteroidales bacterium]
TYQYDRPEFIGMNLIKIIAPEQRQVLTQNKNILDTRGSGTFETIHIRKDSTAIPLEISSRMVEI